MIQKILIANRGEIACRIIRSAHKMGIRCVAVYSEADRKARHVLLADEAYLLGPPPSAQSYLLGDKIISIALACGADAIHPGYGFLSENADFADAVAAAGLVFIGPSGAAMRSMGAKIAAKQTARAAGVPLVPGTEEALQDLGQAKQIALEIGFPVLVKASAGGGGKGMRIISEPDSFAEQVERAMSEAKSSFGDAAVFIEKYIGSPKHIEIQILADSHGNTLYLFERECSIQRRHQKVIEEAPSSAVSPELRRQMGESAVALARTCGYTGAGTVEFLLDESGNYYFLEMNTRLQVEHPVTEYITGLDLVAWQIRIAEGAELDIRQEELRLKGHAIELRVCAEDPANNFLPVTGILYEYREPAGDGIRVDSGFSQGDEIPVYYDPMLAKLIVYADTREAAIRKMTEAIQDYRISGIPTTLAFGAFAINHPAFRDGSFDTHFVERYFEPEALYRQHSKAAEIAAMAALIFHRRALQKPVLPADGAGNKWNQRLLLR